MDYYAGVSVNFIYDPVCVTVNENQEEDCLEIMILPDASGKFGFNVRGGFDQKMPVIVSKVARGSPVRFIAFSKMKRFIKVESGNSGTTTIIIFSQEELGIITHFKKYLIPSESC